MLDPESADRVAWLRGRFEFAHESITLATHEAVITVDEDQRIVMINPAAQRMFGYTASEALGSNLMRLIPERYRKGHAEKVRQFDASGTGERAMGVRNRVVGLRANGQEFAAEAVISRVDLADASGPRRYFTALLRDVSEIEDLKARIDALNERLRAVFDLAPVAIAIVDGDRISFANQACATLFAADNQQNLIGRPVHELLADRSRQAVRQAMEQALRTGIRTTAENQGIARLDGGARDVEIAIAALPDHGHTTLQMVVTDISRQSRESQELERSRRELRQLSASMVEAREEERRRIARELHDELGQRLTALHMELSGLVEQCTERGAAARIVAMLAMVDDTVASVRRISTELRPLMLDDLGLNAAIEWLAKSWSQRMDIAVRLNLGEHDAELAQGGSIALYRMVQEALTNVARHARATQVEIGLRRAAGELVLTVQDNGIGFSEKTLHTEGKHGLMGIRERALMLGGHLEVGNPPGAGGGRVVVRIPADGASKSPRERRVAGARVRGAGPAASDRAGDETP